MMLGNLISELKSIIDLLDKENFDYLYDEDKFLKKYIMQLHGLYEGSVDQAGDEVASIRALVANIKRFIKRIPDHYEQDTAVGFFHYLVGAKYGGKLYERIVEWLMKILKDKDYKEAVNLSRLLASAKENGDLSLDLSHLNLTYEDLNKISRLPNIKKLNLSAIKINGKYINELDDIGLQNFLEMLSRLQKLTHLNLSANLIGQMSAEHLNKLGEYLSDLPYLFQLDLSYNNIKDQGPGIIDLFNENGDILLLPPTATKINLAVLHSNTGYIRVANKLFYVNKSFPNQIIEIPFVGSNVEDEITKFDEKIKPTQNVRRMTKEEHVYISSYIKMKAKLNLHLDANLKSNLLFNNFPSLKKLNLSGNLLRFNKINQIAPEVTELGYPEQLALVDQFDKRNISVDLTYNYINLFDEKTLLTCEVPLFKKYSRLDPARNHAVSGIESVLNPGLFVTKEQGIVVVANEGNHAQIMVQKLDDHLQLSLLKYHLVGGERKSLPPFIPGLEYKYVPPVGPQDESFGLYRAIASITENGDYGALRQKVINQVKNKRLSGIKFLKDDQLIKQYFNLIMQHNTKYADHEIELEVIMHVLGRPIVVFDILGNIKTDSIISLNKFNGEPIFVYNETVIKDHVSFTQYQCYSSSDSDGRDLILKSARKHLLNCKPYIWTHQTMHDDGKILIKQEKGFICYFVGGTKGKIPLNRFPEIKNILKEQQLMALLPKIADIILEDKVPSIPIKLPVSKQKVDGSVIAEAEQTDRICCGKDAKVSIKQLDVTEKYNFFSSNRSLCTYSDFSIVDNSQISELHKIARHHAMHGLSEKLYEYLPTCNEELINCYRFCIKLCQSIGVTIPVPWFLVPDWGLRKYVNQSPLHLPFTSFFYSAKKDQSIISSNNVARQTFGI